jgi:predicted dithiol-disulfide oxidoreductase (DUF899 family)
VTGYPIDELTAFKERMGWNLPYASSLGSDFNFDFGVAYTNEDGVVYRTYSAYARGTDGLWGMY